MESSSKHIKLKIFEEFFEPVIIGTKTFEIRENDKNYKVGDIVELHEVERESGKYTGRSVTKTITYVTSFQQKENYVVFGIKD